MVPGYDDRVSMLVASSCPPRSSALPPFLRAAFVVAVLALALLPAVARGADDTQRAKQLFTQGTTLFNLGEFDKAIEAWQQGYKEKPDPGFLYNIGQAYRLKGDAAKAIFFYRGYLRNAPKAPNRAEVEAKIAVLQKEVTEPKPAPTATPVSPPPPPVAPAPVTPAPRAAPVTPAPPLGPTPIAPPPVAAPPLAASAAAPVAEPPAPMTEPAPSPGENRPVDLAVGLGFEKWTSGLNIKGNAPTQFGFTLGGGYTFGDVFGAASFRLGALLGRTSLQEGAGSTANTLTFWSFLLEPALRVRLVDHRLYLGAALGIGGLSVGGVKSMPLSVVLDPSIKPGSASVSGSIGAFELRPALSLQVHVTSGLVGFVSPAFSFGSKPDHFYKSLDRFEMMFGVAYLF